MGVMRWLQGLAMAGLVGCVTPGTAQVARRNPLADVPPPNGQQHVAPTQPAEAKPWKVGQWATYRMTNRVGVSVVRMRVVAEDGCGFWIDFEIDDGQRRGVPRSCLRREVRPGLRMVRDSIGVITARINGEVSQITDMASAPRRAGLYALYAIIHPAWAGHTGLAQEDVTTPGGTFLQAFKETRTLNRVTRTRWSHPEVPIAGTVRELEGDDELILLAHGESNRSSVVLEDTQQLLARTRHQGGDCGVVCHGIHATEPRLACEAAWLQAALARMQYRGVTPVDWDDLKFLLAVADGAGLAGAARNLRVDPSTVSRRISAIEKAREPSSWRAPPKA